MGGQMNTTDHIEPSVNHMNQKQRKHQIAVTHIYSHVHTHTLTKCTCALDICARTHVNKHTHTHTCTPYSLKVVKQNTDNTRCKSNILGNNKIQEKSLNINSQGKKKNNNIILNNNKKTIILSNTHHYTDLKVPHIMWFRHSTRRVNAQMIHIQYTYRISLRPFPYIINHCKCLGYFML